MMTKIREIDNKLTADPPKPGPHGESDLMRRIELVRTIATIVDTFGYTQAELQRILGQRQPEISKLLGGKGCRFSSAKLMGFIERLGGTIAIDVTMPTKRAKTVIESH